MGKLNDGLKKTMRNAPGPDGKYAEEVKRYFNKVFPGRETVAYHGVLSDPVHIDVNIMLPSGADNFYVLYTTGMSDLPMALPEEVEEKERGKRELAELYVFMPGGWNPGEGGNLDPDLPWENFWVIHMLKDLARFPHEYDTWLGCGHTVPNGPDYEPFTDDGGMGGVVLIQAEDDMEGCETEDGNHINFLMAVPAYREEIEYKLVNGMAALDQVFRERGLPIMIDMRRENYCAGFAGEAAGAKKAYEEFERENGGKTD